MGRRQGAMGAMRFVVALLAIVQIGTVESYSKVRRSGQGAPEERHVVTQRSPTMFPDTRPENDTSQPQNATSWSQNEWTPITKQSMFDEAVDALRLADADSTDPRVAKVEGELLNYVDEALAKDNYVIFDGVKIEPVGTMVKSDVNATRNGAPRSARGNEIVSFDRIVIEKFRKYAKNHVLSVNLPQTARFFGFKSTIVPWKASPTAFTQLETMEMHRLFKKSLHHMRSWAQVPEGISSSSFFTGFGLGFLAFGLKKLLLPLFLGAQIVKSVLIAMFLPSILGSLGKIVGKGLSQFSGSSINLPQAQGEDMDYKDQMGYPSEDEASYTYPNTDTIGTIPANTLYQNMANHNGLDESQAMSRYGPGGAKVTYLPSMSDNHYKNGHKKQEDFKVFKNIPPSSILLSNYDPFYSPLLSRLDSVFQRLGLTEGSEKCRERLVCFMYATPAKYAPYSNLISAQLSRELNELRKPTSDNPEILRFFRYMKAAKEGQEGIDCSRSYPQCPAVSAEGGSAAMITTYNDINKLVSARKLS